MSQVGYKSTKKKKGVSWGEKKGKFVTLKNIIESKTDHLGHQKEKKVTNVSLGKKKGK